MEANSEINDLQQGEGKTTPLKPKEKFYRRPHLALTVILLPIGLLVALMGGERPPENYPFEIGD